MWAFSQPSSRRCSLGTDSITSDGTSISAISGSLNNVEQQGVATMRFGEKAINQYQERKMDERKLSSSSSSSSDDRKRLSSPTSVISDEDTRSSIDYSSPPLLPDRIDSNDIQQKQSIDYATKVKKLENELTIERATVDKLVADLSASRLEMQNALNTIELLKKERDTLKAENSN